MPSYFATTFIGVKDGTKSPADRADGRQVGAKESVIVAPKTAALAFANADLLFVGSLRANEMLLQFQGLTDTSLGATTFDLGTLTNPTKYITAGTLTAVNVPTPLGPKASAVIAGPLAADEDLYVRFNGAVTGATVLAFISRICSVK